MKTENIKIGDRIADNDPRMTGRTLEVVEVKIGGGRTPVGGAWLYGPADIVIAEDTIGRRHKVRINRIFDDGKPRRGGFSLVQP